VAGGGEREDQNRVSEGVDKLMLINRQVEIEKRRAVG
jgi:hypothetical protein